MKWRPRDWKNLYSKKREEDGMFSRAELFEQGADAMLSAVVKWLYDICPHEPFDPLRDMSPMLHKDCPQCMNELRGEE